MLDGYVILFLIYIYIYCSDVLPCQTNKKRTHEKQLFCGRVSSTLNFDTARGQQNIISELRSRIKPLRESYGDPHHIWHELFNRVFKTPSPQSHFHLESPRGTTYRNCIDLYWGITLRHLCSSSITTRRSGPLMQHSLSWNSPTFVEVDSLTPSRK